VLLTGLLKRRDWGDLKGVAVNVPDLMARTLESCGKNAMDSFRSIKFSTLKLTEQVAIYEFCMYFYTQNKQILCY